MRASVHDRAALREILDSVAIAPLLNLVRWEVCECDGPGPGVHGWLIAPVHLRPDRDTGELGEGTGGAVHVPRGATTERVIRSAWLALRQLIDHEALEAFRVAGARIFDPHSPRVAAGPEGAP